MSHIINPEAIPFYPEVPVIGFPLGTAACIGPHMKPEQIRNLFVPYCRYGRGDVFELKFTLSGDRVTKIEFGGTHEFMCYLMEIAGQRNAEFRVGMPERPLGDEPR